MAEEFARALATGLQAALAYNPLAALLGSTAAAMLLAPRDRTLDRTVWSVAAVVIAWLVGDGMRIIARARDLFDGFGYLIAPDETTSAAYLALAIWALLGAALGYVAPAAAGVFVGRRVTHGTGWLAAGNIAVLSSLALSTLVSFVTG